ncbi:MAG TPA: alpha/beta hydrolase [Steroidobacter sp.]|uniref:alpha/beta fold hydrolase n=1 Tax=Steroidobacter sp. TaxID=1978227 RepID=UPI002ED932E3
MGLTRSFPRIALLLSVLLVPWARASEAAPWRDPSPHKVRFSTVAENVQLETLDWGGKGRPIVLLAGGGNTGHVFDDFALKLRERYRVYAVTRRGSPPSSIPEDSYSADRLGDDVVAVISALKLTKPVLMGHSYAGFELSNVASRYPEQIAGVIYLDAFHSLDPDYEAEGFYKIVEWKRQLRDFEQRLDDLMAEPWDSRPLARQMLQENLPQLQAIFERLIRIEDGRPPRPDPTPADLDSFRTLQAWYARGSKVVLPEAEFRMMLATDADGRPLMKFRRPPFVGPQMEAAKRKYTDVRVPALGIFAAMNDPGTVAQGDREARSNSEAYTWFQDERAKRQMALFQRDLPQARAVRIERADHYVFLSNQKEVLEEVNAFIATLP